MFRRFLLTERAREMERHMPPTDREFEELSGKVSHLHRLMTGGDDPERGVLMKLDRIIQQFEMIRKKEDRILAFAVVGVGSGLTGFVSLGVGLILWFITK